MVREKFLDRWSSLLSVCDDLEGDILVVDVHKICNPLLEARYQRFVRSNPRLSKRELIVWHGTSAECNNGTCMSPKCSLCKIIQEGYQKESAREHSLFHYWRHATYFAMHSFACHNYNGASQRHGSNERCTIMTKINMGRTFDVTSFLANLGEAELDHFKNDSTPQNLFAHLNSIEGSHYDTALMKRHQYKVPTEYVISQNNDAAVPIYIVVYYTKVEVQVRASGGKYCSFHNQYHLTDYSRCCQPLPLDCCDD